MKIYQVDATSFYRKEFQYNFCLFNQGLFTFYSYNYQQFVTSEVHIFDTTLIRD
jgi:hypothetical protein